MVELQPDFLGRLAEKRNGRRVGKSGGSRDPYLSSKA